jgi:hypothetical protein
LFCAIAELQPGAVQNEPGLDAREIAKLCRIIAISEKLIAFSARPKRGRPASTIQKSVTKLRKRIRRTGGELIEFRRMLKTPN